MFVAFSTVIGAGIVMFAAIIAGLTETVLPLGLALLAMSLLVLGSIFTMLLPLEYLPDVPTPEETRKFLEDVETTYGNALLIFETWTVVMGGLVAPVLLGEPVSKILMSVGFSMFTFLFALFALHSLYNGRLCSVAIAFAVMAISLTIVAIASAAVMCAPPLTRLVFIAFLGLFLYVDFLVLLSLLGYISKNVE